METDPSRYRAKSTDKLRLYLTLTPSGRHQFHWALALAPKDDSGAVVYDPNGVKDVIVYEARHDPPWRYHHHATNFSLINPVLRILLSKFADKSVADQAIHAVVQQVDTPAYNFNSQTWTRRAMRALARRGIIHVVPLEEIQTAALYRAEYCVHNQRPGIPPNYREHTMDMRDRAQGFLSRMIDQ